MSKELKILGVELDIIWNNPLENCKKIEVFFSDKIADVFLLPEMFNTGFNMQISETAEKMDGFTLSWMKSFANRKKAIVAGSLAIEDEGKFYNRFCWVAPNDEVQFYDKIHLFSYSGEDKVFSPGKEVLIVTYKNWRIVLQICYDLRFPDFVRNTNNYDLIIYVSNWPKVRVNAWKKLLEARAIENQAYVLGLNRSGVDENCWEYESSSRLIFADGEIVTIAENSILDCVLYKDKLLDCRTKMPFLRDVKI